MGGVCLPGWGWRLGPASSVRGGQEPVLEPGLERDPRSWAAQDKGRRIQAGGL